MIPVGPKICIKFDYVFATIQADGKSGDYCMLIFLLAIKYDLRYDLMLEFLHDSFAEFQRRKWHKLASHEVIEMRVDDLV